MCYSYFWIPIAVHWVFAGFFFVTSRYHQVCTYACLVLPAITISRWGFNIKTLILNRLEENILIKRASFALCCQRSRYRQSLLIWSVKEPWSSEAPFPVKGHLQEANLLSLFTVCAKPNPKEFSISSSPLTCPPVACPPLTWWCRWSNHRRHLRKHTQLLLQNGKSKTP